MNNVKINNIKLEIIIGPGETVRLSVVNKGYCLLKKERKRWVMRVLILKIEIRVFICGVMGLIY